MEKVNKTPQRKARLESTISSRSIGSEYYEKDIEKEWRMNLATG
jgi:hypothetical protein